MGTLKNDVCYNGSGLRIMGYPRRGHLKDEQVLDWGGAREVEDTRTELRQTRVGLMGTVGSTKSSAGMCQT